MTNENDPEFAEIQAAVREGPQQAERGEGRPADQTGHTELNSRRAPKAPEVEEIEMIQYRSLGARVESAFTVAALLNTARA